MDRDFEIRVAALRGIAFGAAERRIMVFQTEKVDLWAGLLPLRSIAEV